MYPSRKGEIAFLIAYAIEMLDIIRIKETEEIFRKKKTPSLERDLLASSNLEDGVDIIKT